MKYVFGKVSIRTWMYIEGESNGNVMCPQKLVLSYVSHALYAPT